LAERGDTLARCMFRQERRDKTRARTSARRTTARPATHAGRARTGPAPHNTSARGGSRERWRVRPTRCPRNARGRGGSRCGPRLRSLANALRPPAPGRPQGPALRMRTGVSRLPMLCGVESGRGRPPLSRSGVPRKAAPSARHGGVVLQSRGVAEHVPPSIPDDRAPPARWTLPAVRTTCDPIVAGHTPFPAPSRRACLDVGGRIFGCEDMDIKGGCPPRPVEGRRRVAVDTRSNEVRQEGRAKCKIVHSMG